MERVSYIYKVTNLVNSKAYIGQSIDPVKRIPQHIRSRSKKNYLLHYAIKKYGIENFLFEVIKSEIPIEQINEIEIQCIQDHNCKAPLGYNLTDGGGGIIGYVYSEETKKKMSVAHIGQEAWNKGKKSSEETRNKISLASKGNKNGFYGKKHGQETKDKLSAVHIGKRHSEDTRAKISRSNTGKSRSKEAKNKMSIAAKNRLPISEETRRKISIASKGRIAWNKGKKNKPKKNKISS